jgi:hypothetical protein
MADESDEVEAPILPVHSAAPVDEGLAAWAGLIANQIAMRGGVEMLETSAAAVRFRFRGQTFAIQVYRTS